MTLQDPKQEEREHNRSLYKKAINATCKKICRDKAPHLLWDELEKSDPCGVTFIIEAVQ